jgi:hypothetical protein
VLNATGSFAAKYPHSSAVSPSRSEGGRCKLPLREFIVYPYGSMAREATRAIRFLGLRASLWLFNGRRAKEAPYQNRIIITFVEPSEDVG